LLYSASIIISFKLDEFVSISAA